MWSNGDVWHNFEGQECSKVLQDKFKGDNNGLNTWCILCHHYVETYRKPV